MKGIHMTKINWKSVLGWGAAALVVIGIIGTNMYQMREKKTDKPVVKIGITLPLTGAMGKFGQEIKKGIELRLSQIPENTKYRYKVIYEDSTWKQLWYYAAGFLFKTE